MKKYQVILIIFLLLLIVLNIPHVEGFINKDDKANAIYQWFKSQTNPQYSQFRDYTKGQSNIVEYEDTLRLYNRGNLSVDSIKNIL